LGTLVKIVAPKALQSELTERRQVEVGPRRVPFVPQQTISERIDVEEIRSPSCLILLLPFLFHLPDSDVKSKNHDFALAQVRNTVDIEWRAAGVKEKRHSASHAEASRAETSKSPKMTPSQKRRHHFDHWKHRIFKRQPQAFASVRHQDQQKMDARGLREAKRGE